MQTFDLYNYYRDSKDHNIILSFKGALSQEILVEIGQIIKNKYVLDKQIKKIFAVFVELSQNIMHYSAEREINPRDGNEVGVGIMVFTENNEFFYIISGNLIKTSKAEKLSEKIDKINQMDKEQLKEQYLAQRKMPQAEDSKGAGLGFIDIARKSSGQIEYSINGINEEFSFFKLTVKFDKEAN